MKRRVITFIMLMLAIGTLLTGCVREETMICFIKIIGEVAVLIYEHHKKSRS